MAKRPTKNSTQLACVFLSFSHLTVISWTKMKNCFSDSYAFLKEHQIYRILPFFLLWLWPSSESSNWNRATKFATKLNNCTKKVKQKLSKLSLSCFMHISDWICISNVLDTGCDSANKVGRFLDKMPRWILRLF